MWSSVRRYRGRNNRDDDFNFTCSCITDWCFTWCSNQCAKKPEQRSSLASEISNESEQPQTSKCCTFGCGCLVRTTQVEQNVHGSQVLQEDFPETEQVEWASQPPAIEADPAKTETSREDANDIGYWAFLRRLRRLRPRFFGGTTTITSVTNEVKEDVPKLSGLQRLGLWFRQLGQRGELAPSSPQDAATPSAVIAEGVNEEVFMTDTDEEQIHHNDDVSGSAWSRDPFIVFARGNCGYESFDPNCCRLWQTINYSITEETNVTDFRYSSTASERPVSASRDFKTPEVAKPGCKRPIDVQKSKLLSDKSIQQMASVTLITVASELDTHIQKGMDDSSMDKDECEDMLQTSKQTQVHSPDALDTGRQFIGIEESEVARDIVSLIGPPSVPSSDGALTQLTQPVSTLDLFQPKIPEVILTRAATPELRARTECSSSSAAVNRQISKNLQRQGAVDTDPSPKPDGSQYDEDQDSDSVKAEILNFMIKSSPKRVPTPRIRLETSKALKNGAGSSDVRKKIVRFKEPSFSHSTTKGRAVYIGTSKHSSAPKREIIDCVSMTVERRRVTLEETQVSEGVSFHETSPIDNVINQSRNNDPEPTTQGGRESPKGVKEYVNEYSELCKTSVDQERQILQTVIDSVRECYKMPTSLEDNKDHHDTAPQENQP